MKITHNGAYNKSHKHFMVSIGTDDKRNISIYTTSEAIAEPPCKLNKFYIRQSMYGSVYIQFYSDDINIMLNIEDELINTYRGEHSKYNDDYSKSVVNYIDIYNRNAKLKKLLNGI